MMSFLIEIWEHETVVTLDDPTRLFVYWIIVFKAKEAFIGLMCSLPK